MTGIIQVASPNIENHQIVLETQFGEKVKPMILGEERSALSGGSRIT